MDKNKLLKLATAVIENEAESVLALKDRLGEPFIKACDYLLHCSGRVVVTGMGKSGHIGSKIAATLASTGTPAFFVHPGEASHGDLGMITSSDVVIALSNSGETDELLIILPLIKRLGVPLISMTGNADSRLAREAEVNLDTSVAKEACPLGLAPTSSTTVTLVMGDALAISLLESKGFTAKDFALSHPGGRLGKRLLLHIEDIMQRDNNIPIVAINASLAQALKEMSDKGMGMTVVTKEDNTVAGIFTDGDLRRLLDHGQIDISTIKISDCIKSGCTTITANQLAVIALKFMEEKSINSMPVVNEQNKLIGALNMQDLLRAGVV